MKLSIPLCMNGRGCCFPAARLGCSPQSHGGTLLDHNMETKSQREESREYCAGCSTQHGSFLSKATFAFSFEQGCSFRVSFHKKSIVTSTEKQMILFVKINYFISKCPVMG